MKTSEKHTDFLIWGKGQQIYYFCANFMQSVKLAGKSLSHQNKSQSSSFLQENSLQTILARSIVCFPHLVTVGTRYTSLYILYFEDSFISINRCRFVCNSKTTLFLGTTVLPKLQIMTNRYKSTQYKSSKLCMVLKAVWMLLPHIT